LQENKCGAEALALLSRVLEVNPSKRPHAAQLLNGGEVLGRVKPPINVY
jgi:hypothetical protein